MYWMVPSNAKHVVFKYFALPVPFTLGTLGKGLLVWFLFVLLLLFNFEIQAQQDLSFTHYTTNSGLSNNTVRCIYQDNKGFIWIGTDGGGLNKFDGYHFTLYEFRGNDKQSISSNYITAIAEDRQGNLWIGTSNGLNRLDAITGHIQRFHHDSLDKNSLNHDRVTTLLIDADNQLWIGTAMGLQRYNLSTKTFTDYSRHIKTVDNRKEKAVTRIVDDGRGNLWIGVWWGGLKKLEKATGIITDYFADPGDPYGPENNNVISLCPDQWGNLWVGNFSGGLSKFSLETGRFLRIENRESNTSIWSICTDSNGKIWYTRTGVGIVETHSGHTRQVDFSKHAAEGISSGYHYYIYCDQSGSVWLGSTEGLSLFNRYSKRFSPYMRLIDQRQRYYVTTFYHDPDEPVMWIGTFGNGIIKLNEQTGQYTRFSAGKSSEKNTPENYIVSIQGDGKNRLWVATTNGIAILDKTTGTIVRTINRNTEKPEISNSARGSNGLMFTEDDSIRIYDIAGNRVYTFGSTGPGALPNRIILSALKENNDNLWIGTAGGLVKYHTKIGKTETYIDKGLSANSISGESILSIFRDSRNNLWVGTQNGLNRYDKNKDCFVRFSDDFSNQSVNSITEDSKGNLWLVTEKGITKVNPQTRQIRNYTEYDGLKADGVLHKSSDGSLYCNRSREGYYHFHPDSIQDDLHPPRVYITRFLLFNKEVPVSSNNEVTPLKSDILNTKEITLKYNQSVISFEFTALNFAVPEKNTFAYQLQGFDNNWYTTMAAHRMATYTNLDAGNYVFRVKAANSDGIWSSNLAELKIKVLPPPWKTWWAYTLYALTFAAIVLFFRHNAVQKEKLKNKIRLEAMEYERKIKMDEMKMRFFANISHEFRTPLTLIMAPLHAILQTVRQRTDSQIAAHAGLIQRNANRLAELINQLLDMQKLEAKSMKPEICEGNITAFLKAIHERFTVLSARQFIQYPFICPDVEIKGWFDPDKTEKIVTNLLSNAFKFTGNFVKLELQKEEDQLLITVEDNGKGIPSEHLERIFDRFYHVDDSAEKIREGTGIGLSLVKEMTDLLNGKITVSSEVGKYTRFSVLLPITRESFSDFTVRTLPAISADSFAGFYETADREKPVSQAAPANAPLIMIVEDNPDLRAYLKLVLSPVYRITEAANGKEGLAMAREHIPDLIISDIMMPEMDGLQMSKHLKTDIQTDHIPIVMLTSLGTTDYKLKGLETGVDDYITKPFNDDILLLRIANLINQRKRLQRFYATKYGLGSITAIQPKETEIVGSDELFLGKMVALVEKNIEDPDFTNEKFAAGMSMSVAVLYRKTNALINCTPADFVRDLKLKRAIQLLGTGKLPVAEVAGRIGFNDPHYFGKWFKKNYGQSPSELMPD